MSKVFTKIKDTNVGNGEGMNLNKNRVTKVLKTITHPSILMKINTMIKTAFTKRKEVKSLNKKESIKVVENKWGSLTAVLLTSSGLEAW